MHSTITLGNAEYFVIDSEKLADVSDKLYGFAFQSQNVSSQSSLGQEMGRDAGGAYVKVERSGNLITISQDFLGSFGLYLYSKNGRFVLSNSFFKLVEYLSHRTPLTLNDRYLKYLVIADLCSASCRETLISEISFLPRNILLRINILEKKLEITSNACLDGTVPVDSLEGLRILDGWYEKWTNTLRAIASDPSNSLTTDLSGGMDSRITLCLLLGSGINMERVRVNSIKDTLHTHQEDYRIASEIAQRFGFELNQSPKDRAALSGDTYFSLEEALDISFLCKLGSHKQLSFKTKRSERPRFIVTGSGGECLRSYWDISPEEYIENALKACYRMPAECTNEYAQSARSILEKSFEDLACITGSKYSGNELTRALYKETRARIHFGRDVVESYFANEIKCTPLIDESLFKLQTYSNDCPDNNLLIAIIFERYLPELLSFDFEGGRSIAKDTLEYARSINERFPRERENTEEPTVFSNYSSQGSTSGSDKTRTTYKDIESCICDSFNSREARIVFDALGTDVAYLYQSHRADEDAYRPLQHLFPVLAAIAASKAATPGGAEVKVSQYIEELSCAPKTTVAKDTSMTRYIENLITARIDIKNVNETNLRSLAILNAEGGRVRISSPSWFSTGENKGSIFESSAGALRLQLEILEDGDMTIALRSRNIRRTDASPFPILIDYEALEIDGKEVLGEAQSAWHDCPIKHSFAVKKGQTISVFASWKPHNPINDAATTQGNIEQPQRKKVGPTSSCVLSNSPSKGRLFAKRLLSLLRRR